MKKIIILVIVIGVLVGGYFVLKTDSTEDLNGDVATTGVVLAVDLSGLAFDGPALVTIEGDSSEDVVIAVPSMGLPLCEASPQITETDLIEVGDIVSVRGVLDEAGRIVPCTEKSHYLSVSQVVSDQVIGYQFEYRKGPDGYIILPNDQSQHPDFVSGHTLFERREYELFITSSQAREGPPAIQVQIYDNPEKLQPPVWAKRNPQESNVELALAEPVEAVVGGANAARYTVDGLYPTDTYVVAHDNRIYILSGAYLDQESKIYQAFQNLVSTFEFIQTSEQL